jgi:RNA polymerase sigma-70 factor (ECF subfamily)
MHTVEQIFPRAMLRVREGRPRFEVPSDHACELIERFLKAARSGDVESLERMLAADATATADGGGLVTAARRPILGANNVARYLAGLFHWEVPGMEVLVREINGAPAAIAKVAGDVLLVVGRRRQACGDVAALDRQSREAGLPRPVCSVGRIACVIPVGCDALNNRSSTRG